MRTITIDDIRQMAVTDATEAYNESQDTSTPDGGWDSYLINGIGCRGVCLLFGEDPAANEDGWSESMQSKLIAYNAAAVEAMESIRNADADAVAVPLPIYFKPSKPCRFCGTVVVWNGLEHRYYNGDCKTLHSTTCKHSASSKRPQACSIAKQQSIRDSRPR